MLEFKSWLFEEANHEYSCVMAMLPQKESTQISKWIKKHIPQSNIHEKQKEQSDLHVTALYGLHTQNIKDIEETLNGFGKIEAVLGIVSRFVDHPEYDVLKIEVQSADLKRLNRKLKTLNYTSKYPYKPHCTLAYLKKGSCKNLVGNKRFAGINLQFKHVTFSTPSGKKHKVSCE